MTHKEYANAAIDIVIDLAAEQGLKYRRGDFRVEGVAVNNGSFLRLNTVSFVGGNKEPTGISVILPFGHERVGKKLKACKDNFYNYKYCRVLDVGIFFGFSLAEIEIQSAREEETERSMIEIVIKKVQKILSLADPSKNPSEAEALSASLMAQKLLAKYNIDIATVTGEEKQEEIEQVIADVGTGKKWKYNLANIIATSYCCKCFYQGTEMIVFYGYSSDVLIARRVFMYLFRVGNSLATKYVKARRDGGEWNTGGLYNSFCKGFCDGINKELQKNCTALVLVTPQKVVESFDEYSKDFKKLDHDIDMNDREAYIEGKIEGKRALNAQYITEAHPTSNTEIGDCRLTFSVVDKTNGIFADEISITLVNLETTVECNYTVSKFDYLFGLTVGGDVKQGKYNIALNFPSKGTFIVQNADGTAITSFTADSTEHTFNWIIVRDGDNK